jgi:chromosome segregation ATPase
LPVNIRVVDIDRDVRTKCGRLVRREDFQRQKKTWRPYWLIWYGTLGMYGINSQISHLTTAEKFMAEEFRSRAASCQAAGLQSTRNACVARAVESLRKLETLTLDADSKSVFGDATNSAARILTRLKEELARLSSGLENEKHIQSVLQAKMSALQTKHHANIAAVTEQERSKCAEEITTLTHNIASESKEKEDIEAFIQSHTSTLANLKEKLADKEKVILEFTPKLALERNYQTQAQRDVERCERLYEEATRARKQAMEDRRERAAHLKETKQSGENMVSLAKQRVHELQLALNEEIGAKLAAQAELRAVEAEVEAALRPDEAMSDLPNLEGLTYVVCVCVCVCVCVVCGVCLCACVRIHLFLCEYNN